MNEVNDMLVIEKSDEILEDTNESPGCNDTLNCFMIFILFSLPKTRDLGGICDCLVNMLVVQYCKESLSRISTCYEQHFMNSSCKLFNSLSFIKPNYGPDNPSRF